MTTAYSLRPIQDDDVEFLYRLYASTRVDVENVDWSDEEKEQFLRLQFKAQHEYYQQSYANPSFDVILNAGGESIGRLYVDRRDDEIRVVDIALMPDQRRRGVGGAVMNSVLDEAQRANKPVRIHVERYNPAIQWYSRLGFQQIGDTGVYYFMEWSPTEPATL